MIFNKKNKNLYGVSSWYTTLADYTFPTTFVKLKEDEIDLIANGTTKGEKVEAIQARIGNAQKSFTGNTFVFTDNTAPTDTERFKNKKGAVYSATSAWNNLIQSEKIREAAKKRLFEYICIRPFRNMQRAREFRLFIYDGELKLMSQYWLFRQFGRLKGRKDLYWKLANDLVDEIGWLLPSQNIVLDIYFTAKDTILLIDFNKWGPPTKPLLAENWDMDWDEIYGIKILE